MARQERRRVSASPKNCGFYSRSQRHDRRYRVFAPALARAGSSRLLTWLCWIAAPNLCPDEQAGSVAAFLSRVPASDEPEALSTIRPLGIPDLIAQR